MILAIYECTGNYRFSWKFDLTIFGCLSLSDCTFKTLWTKNKLIYCMYISEWALAFKKWGSPEPREGGDNFFLLHFPKKAPSTIMRRRPHVGGWKFKNMIDEAIFRKYFLENHDWFIFSTGCGISTDTKFWGQKRPQNSLNITDCNPNGHKVFRYVALKNS